MIRYRLSKTLFAGALALVALSSAHARPMVLEPRDAISFGNGVVGRNHARFELANTSASDDDNSVLGTSRHAPSPLGRINSEDNHPVFGWDHPDPAVPSSHGPHGHDPQGHGRTDAIDELQRPGRHGNEVAAVTAIPEPSTYVLMMAGLVGIAAVTLRRRSRGR